MSKNVLVAVELDDFSASCVLNKALAFGSADDTYHVLHVVDPNTVAYVADPTFSGKIYDKVFKNAIDHAQQRLNALCQSMPVQAAHRHVRYGRIANEIHKFIDAQQIDLLIIGSHGRTGWRRILGSKASSILHGCSIDTLVLKLDEPHENQT